MKIRWYDEAQAHDVDAANSYLALITDRHARFDLTVEVEHPAKDLIRASGLPLLPEDNVHVKADLYKISNHEALSPVLIIPGRIGQYPLIIADGYHRVCAAYHHDENAMIPAYVGAFELPRPRAYHGHP